MSLIGITIRLTRWVESGTNIVKPIVGEYNKYVHR